MRIAFGFHLTGLLFAALGCAAGAQSAPPKSQPFAQFVGKPFSATRAAIVGGGWSPRETRLTTAKGEPERARGEAGKLLEAGYVEVERCTGGERNYCFFNYGRGGKCLRVRTLGVLREADVEPKVHGVGDACPSKQKGVD